MEKKIKEVRLREVRALEDTENDVMKIEGYAIVFDEPTDLGGYIEIIERGALDDCDMSDVCLKYNHEDTYLVMARTRNKSLQLEVDDHGLKVYAELIDTQSNRDVYKSIRAGLLDKMSFAFVVSDANWDTVDGVDIRRITGIGKLFDVSVVDVPAYDQTEVFARSKEAVEKEQSSYHDLKLEKEKIKLKLKL
jgi:HK97 family phage prohead protease